jgi:lipopolysaccharide/colanic/teichoic acid biosynthesis glycosyltransferase
MLRATIREETEPGRSTVRRRLPERLSRAWTLALVCTDACAVLAAAYMAGLPAGAGPATCVIICGAIALCGFYSISYAVRWYDELYQVIVACAVAFVPLWALLHLISAQPSSQAIAALLLSALLLAAERAALHLARGSNELSDAGAVCVSPEAQWRVRHGFYVTWKRTFDFAVAAFALLALSPLMLLSAVCIVIESGFPILFRQERVGRNGVPFVMYKFRTMWQDAGTQWAQPGDGRITNVGTLLRRSSLDELPQLFNVVRGEMSLVGPRPEMQQFARDFRRRIAHYEDRHIVRPGLTGWAQVYAKRNLRPEEMRQVVPYDIFYVEHACAALDATVVAKTAAEFLFHRAV